MKKLLTLLLTAVGLALCHPAQSATVTVFAAASLTDSLKELAASYEKQTNDKIVFNFAASGPLARQIEAGAPADIFFSADEAKMDAVAKKGLIVTATRRSRLSNRLAIVTTADSSLAIAAPQDLAAPRVKRLALGNTKTVPAGTYAKEYLTRLKLWPGVEKKIVPCENVRAVLAAVESGNVDAGIVYKTDAAISKQVKVVYEVSAPDGPKISYPLALVTDSRQPAAAGKFLDYLTSPAAGAVFARHGFIVLTAAEKQ